MCDPEGESVQLTVGEFEHPRSLNNTAIRWFVNHSLKSLTDEKPLYPEPDVSVIIRNRNEIDDLEFLLQHLRNQDYDGGLELIVVDNESTDGSRRRAKRLGAKIVDIAYEDFSYPKASNAGLAAAENDLAAITVAHAVPAHDRWLRAGARHFANPAVAGVHSIPLPGRNATFWEKVGYPAFYIMNGGLAKPKPIIRAKMGTLGATNAMLNRRLWEIHPFDEAYGLGGEDGAWAKWALRQFYDIVYDPAFAVHHSHGNGFWGTWRQFLYWQRLDQPTQFDRHALRFRNQQFRRSLER